MAVLRTRDLTFLRRGGHFRHASPHSERLCCVHWCLLRQCPLKSSSGGDFGESSRSISDRRDDSNQEAQKEKDRIELANYRSGAEPRHCACTGADAGCRRSANAHHSDRREKDRTQPESGLDATKSKTGGSERTGAFCGRARSSCRACRKENSTEKTTATCSATADGEHFGSRSGIAFGGTIHGNHRAFA